MKNLASFLTLPTSLLSLITASYGQELAWPYNLPRTAKYYPEHEQLIQKELAAQKRLLWQRPVGMKKMSGDDGEKFFLHYWNFEGNETQLLPPLAPHSYAGNSLFARSFKCPGDSHSCSSIGSDLCCESGQRCISTNNGVGCCPRGETCGEEIGACSDGYHSCPNSSNGGCCIPGSVCRGTGCVLYGTYTVTTTLPTKTKTEIVSTYISSGSTSLVYTTSTGEKTVTETEVITGPGRTTTTTVTVTSGTASTCKSGFHSCPASLGGGCCTSGQQCASSGCPDHVSSSSSSLSQTTSATASQPVRPTSNAATTHKTKSIDGSCPTNYYLCSAHYIGCCKIERDCAVLSCPPSASTIIETSGVTIIASASTSVRGQTCASGWHQCPASEDGGCCPSGYQCGTSNCMETRGGIVQSRPKETASSGAMSLNCVEGGLTLAVAVGIGMVLV